jgi:hypothetical protein
VLAGEIVIESAQQQLFEPRLAVALGFKRGRRRCGMERVGCHQSDSGRKRQRLWAEAPSDTSTSVHDRRIWIQPDTRALISKAENPFMNRRSCEIERAQQVNRTHEKTRRLSRLLRRHSVTHAWDRA